MTSREAGAITNTGRPNTLRPRRKAWRLDRRLLLLASVVAASALLTGPAGAEEGTLIIETDSACSLINEEVFVFRVEPDIPRELTIEEGTYDLACIAVETWAVFWEDTVQVDGDESLEVAIIIAEDVEMELEIDPPEWKLDGELESRLELIDPGTRQDPETELVWTDIDNAFNIEWENAAQYCGTLQLPVADLDTEERPWRLPTVEELESIVDDDAGGVYRVLGGLRLSGCCVWSSEEYGSVSAWYMDFDNGRRGFVARDYYDGGRVLCVR